MPTEIKILKEVDCRDAIFISGLPGIGMVGKTVVDYLIKKLGAEKFAELTSDSFPPVVVPKGDSFDLLKDEFYFYNKEKNKFIFLSGQAQPSFQTNVSEQQYEFSKKIVDFLQESGVKLVISIAGLNIREQRLKKKPLVSLLVSRPDLLTDYDALKTSKGMGLMLGSNVLIPALAKERNLDSAIFFGETSENIIVDVSAAIEVLKVLDKIYDFNIDLIDIEKDSERLKKEIEAINKLMSAGSDKAKKEKDRTYIR
jgi:hypothetical protein